MGMWLHIHAGIKINPCKRASDYRLSTNNYLPTPVTTWKHMKTSTPGNKLPDLHFIDTIYHACVYQ